MLKEFRVRNFLSIKDEIILSMEPGAYLKKFGATNVSNINGNRILKNAVIFGPNGSGKTNVISALQTMKNIILHETNKVTDRLIFRPFILEENSIDTTTFSINFLYEEYEYLYTFEYNDNKVFMEELKVKKRNNIEVVFFYNKNENVSNLTSNLNADLTNLRDNQLFIYKLQSINEEHSSNVFRWLHTYLIIDNFDEIPHLMPFEMIKSITNDKNKERLLHYLKYADTNIIDIEVIKNKELPNISKINKIFKVISEEFEGSDINFEEVFERELYSLQTIYHKFDKEGNIIGRERLSLSAESKGTQKLINLALVLLNIGNDNKTIIIDELDNSFHNNIMIALLQLFNSKQNNNQLIFTTHNIMIIDEKLRTDQIYFVEKDYRGKSDLYSLFDFNESSSLPRGDIKYLNRYMSGSFGALPYIEPDKMIELIEKESE